MGVQFHLVTAAPPAEVFAAVADFGRIGGWDPFVARSELIAGEPMQVGSRYRLTAPAGMTLEYQIEQLAPLEKVVYRGGTRRVTSTDSIAVAPSGPGTRVTVSSNLRFTGWTRLISPVILFGVWAGARFISMPAMKRHVGNRNPAGSH